MPRGMLWCVVFSAALAGAAPDGIDLKVRTNRTALWVGDRLEYVVRVEHPASVEFVRDHLKKEEMNLAPFELLEIGSAVGSLPGNRRSLEVRMLLTIYDVDHTEATVPSFNLFYFRQGQTPGKDDSPAEVLAVPPLIVGLRSAVIDPGLGIRDYKPVIQTRTVNWLAPEILGLLGLAVVAVSVAWLIVAQISSGFWKRKLAERTRKKSFWDSLREIRETPASSAEELSGFYKKASEILRALAAERLSDGAGLTPLEMRSALRDVGSPEQEASALSDLLEQCDLIRYAPDGLEQGRKSYPDFLRKLEELAGQHS